jgi:hypothetical protein
MSLHVLMPTPGRIPVVTLVALYPNTVGTAFAAMSLFVVLRYGLNDSDIEQSNKRPATTVVAGMTEPLAIEVERHLIRTG